LGLLAGQVAARRLIAVPERRGRRLSTDEWSALANSEGFWRLVDRGYLDLRRRGGGRYELRGRKYVGRALLDRVELRIEEKVPGAVAALASAATGAELRLETEEAPASEFDAISRHLMRAFAVAAGEYVAKRRKARFRYRDAVGPMLSGSIDVAATMRLHAGGRRGLFAFQRCEVVRDEPLDRLVLAAFEELDRSARALGLDADTVYKARWLASGLAEVRDEAFVRTPAARFLELADEIEEDPATGAEDADLARLAAVVLLHRGFGLDPEDGVAPRAWFIDMETLFERAVRETLAKVVAEAEVDRGESFARWLFRGGKDRSRVNPDLIAHRDRVVLAVGDVKYKSLEPGAEGGGSEKKEGRADLYQVLVHAASLECDRALLVYPAESGFECRRLGRAATGAETWTTRVRPTQLETDLRRLVGELGLADP